LLVFWEFKFSLIIPLAILALLYPTITVFLDILYKKIEKQKWEAALIYFMRKHFIQLFLKHLIHIVLTYAILLIFNQVISFSKLKDQFKMFLFSDKLVIETDVKVLGLLILIVIISYVSSNIIDAFIYDLPKSDNTLINQEKAKQNKTREASNETYEQTAVAKENVSSNIKSDDLAKQLEEHFSRINSDSMIEEAYEYTKEEGDKRAVKFQYHKYIEENNDSRGKYIGILERIIVAFCVVSNTYHGLILLGAIKTLARFKRFEKEGFAEYYLIGSLLSVLLGLFCGMMINRII
jgi:hypothetical protein